MSESFEGGYALLIGVGADLPDTVNDARGMADILKDQGRCAYPPAQVTLLTGESADRLSILAALDRLALEADDNATVVVYFSGHGHHVSSSIGEAYYLMPYNYDINRLSQTAISGSEFVGKLKAIKAQKLLLLLDCCHAGGMSDLKAPGLQLSKAPLPPEAQGLFAEGRGRVVIASSQADEYSLAGTPYSAFTLALIEALCGAGVSEKDGYVRVSDLALHTRQMVPQRSKNRQHPILRFRQADDFVLAYYAGGEKKPKGMLFSEEPEIEPEPGAWGRRSVFDQRGQTVHGPQTNIAGNVQGPVFSGQFSGPVAMSGDAVDMRSSKGAIYKPSVLVNNLFWANGSEQIEIDNIDKRILKAMAPGGTRLQAVEGISKVLSIDMKELQERLTILAGTTPYVKDEGKRSIISTGPEFVSLTPKGLKFVRDKLVDK